jgi:hypothetical protein
LNFVPCENTIFLKQRIPNSKSFHLKSY